MKIRIRIYWLLLVVFSCCNVLGDWYLWQRAKSEECVRAAASVRPEKIFYLAWELSVDPQGRWQWHKGAAFDPAPGDTPVLRASAAALQDPDRLVREIAGKIRSGISGTSLQLDLDVPERQLALYGNLLRQWRREFPEIRWSVTLLPCHLGRRELKDVLQNVDFWVLQLHGIAAPRHRQERFALMEPDTVQKALEQARQQQKPFFMALPTYAYVLRFYPDGRFQRLWAEGFPESQAGSEDLEIAAPDLPLIARIIRENPDIPVIWFRLPSALDRWALDLETIRLLEKGHAPDAGTEWQWRREDGIRKLYFRFRYQIPFRKGMVTVPPEIRKEGEWMYFNGAAAPDLPYGATPEAILMPPFRCGKWVLVAVLLGKEREE